MFDFVIHYYKWLKIFLPKINKTLNRVNNQLFLKGLLAKIKNRCVMEQFAKTTEQNAVSSKAA